MSGARRTRALAANTVTDSGTVTDARLELPRDARLAVLGSPISHSKSPAIHAAAYSVLGLNWQYDRHELVASELESYLAMLGEDYRGLSLTMPLKEEAHRLARVLDPIAEQSGVVNTLFRVAGVGASAAWAGFNTDVGGLASAISREGLDATRTIVFGAGATAVSAVLAARSLGAERISVFARRIEAAAALAARFDGCAGPAGTPVPVAAGELFAPLGGEATDAAAASDATLIISTLPGHGIEWQRVPLVGSAATFDVAYDPWPSPLAELTREAGTPVFSGVGMLIEQALLQIRIFVNGDPVLPLENEDALREAMWQC